MALSIISSCVNCWACMDVCPQLAIRPDTPHFKINSSLCSECDGSYSVPQCASICPIEGAILLADGLVANPAGSLTGIPPEAWEETMQHIQAR